MAVDCHIRRDRMAEVHTYKVVLVGELGVGKSSIFMRFRDDIFHENYDGTRGMDHATKKIDAGKEKVAVSLTTILHSATKFLLRFQTQK